MPDTKPVNDMYNDSYDDDIGADYEITWSEILMAALETMFSPFSYLYARIKRLVRHQ